jgi:hypothetical protein
MFQIMILICALDVSRADCRPESALDVIHGPEVANEMMCGFHGQAFLASTSLAPRLGREYMKIQCLRTSAGREARRNPPLADQEQ